MNDDSRNEVLLQELIKNREELREMLKTILELRKKADELLPSSNDFRKRYIMDEKIKLITSIFDLELKTRDRIDSSIKNEFELRRKTNSETAAGKGYTIEEIEAIASILESSRKLKNEQNQEENLNDNK